MNEFCQRYAKLKRSERVKVRENMIAAAMLNMSLAVKGNHTTAQVRALARKKVDQAISLARKIA